MSRKSCSCNATAAILLTASFPATAQEGYFNNLPIAIEKPTIDQNGVDVSQGVYVGALPAIAIGPPDSRGIALSVGLGQSPSNSLVGGARCDREQNSCSFTINGVFVGTFAWEFGETWSQRANTGATITGPSMEQAVYGPQKGQWKLTERDGTEHIFRRDGDNAYMWAQNALLRQTTYPDGVVVSYEYSRTSQERLEKVSNNLGYAVYIGYKGNEVDARERSDFYTMVSVSIANLANLDCSGDKPCTQPKKHLSIERSAEYALEYNAPTPPVISWIFTPYRATYSYLSGSVVFVDYNLAGFKRWDGSASAVARNELVFSVRNTSQGFPTKSISYSDGVNKWNYLFELLSNSNPIVTKTVRTSPLQSIEEFGFNVFPAYQTDALGRRVDFTYTDERLSKTVYPTGMSISYVYDVRGNITSRTYARSAIDGGPSISVIESFASGCLGRKTCNKPLSRADPNGNITGFLYAPEHGGVLTKTNPADATGLRSVIRNSYAQRFAWIVNPSGGYMQAGGPIWLLSETRGCRTTETVEGGCAGGTGDELVTSYDYGPDTGTMGNNLLLRGVMVTASGQTQRFCYNYDNIGNRTSETKPLAAVAACY